MPTDSVTPTDLAAAIRRRASGAPVSIYWIAVSGSRATFADELNAQLRDFPAAAIVVRGARFQNPNCVFDDFISLVREEREVLERELRGTATDACAVVLVGRSELCLSQASSPVPLPDWFPVAGGATVTSRIEDLSWTAEAPLDADIAQTDNLCQLLFDLDGVLLDSLTLRQRDRRAVQSLFDRIRRDDEGTSDLLGGAELARRAVQNPTAYRPSVRHRRTIVARLWFIVQNERPEGLAASGKALQQALGVPSDLDATWHETFVAVLSRPANRDAETQGNRFARNALLTLASSAQFITAAAHADAYPAYPVPLIRATSYDLRRGLSDAIGVLRSL